MAKWKNPAWLAKDPAQAYNGPPDNKFGALDTRRTVTYLGWELRRLPERTVIVRGRPIIVTNSEFTGKRVRVTTTFEITKKLSDVRVGI